MRPVPYRPSPCWPASDCGSDNLLVLTDDHSDKFMLPTRRNIERGFEWLRRDIKAGDSLFFYFSGE